MTPIPYNGNFTDADALTNLVNFFRANSVIGYENLLPYSITLLLIFVGIDIVFSWSIYNGSMRMQELVSKLIKVGILLFIIQHLPEMTRIIIRSFQQWGLIAAGANLDIKNFTTPTEILNMGIKLITNPETKNGILEQMAKISIFTNGGLSTLFMCLIAMCCIVFSFFMMAIELAMVIIEFNILASILVILIPFAAMKQTSFLFQRCVSTVINYGIKMMIIYFLIALVATTAKLFTRVNVTNLGDLLTQSLIYLALGYIVCKVPTIISGMLNGQPSMSGNGVASSVASAPGKALSTAGAAIGGVAAVAAASRVQGVNKWDTFKSSSAQFGKNMLGMAKAKAGASVLRGADKTNELLRAGNAIENGTWKRQTDEQRNTGIDAGMTTSKNVPLSKKAQENVKKLENSVSQELGNLNKFEPPTSNPYSISQQSGYSYVPMPKAPAPPSSSNTGEPTSATESSTPKNEEPTSANDNETDKPNSN